MAKGKHRKRFRRKVKKVKTELEMAYSRIQFVVDWLDKHHFLVDHTFTFPDGQVWIADAHKKEFV